MEWTLTRVSGSDEAVTLVFSLTVDSTASAHWPHRAIVEHRIAFGPGLTMELLVRNSDSGPFSFEEALHTYFAVSEIEHATVAGLERTDYLDKVAGFARRRQDDDPIRFTGETDRIYQDTEAACVIHDPGLQRRITVSKSGSRSTIVWNPSIDKARSMADFGDSEWRRMVCVETANVGAAAVRLEPGATHVMSVRIDVGGDAP
jgi:glucose-6-phosphate 1-epimerase